MVDTSQAQIPPNYVIGKVLEDEDSFFSSIAQGLKQLKRAQPMSKELWEKCQKHVKEYLESSHVYGNKPTTIFGINVDHYLAYLDKGVTGPPNSVRSRPEQEGRIICQVFNVKIHILNKPDHDNPDWWHCIVNRLGQNRITGVDYESNDTIHLISLGDLLFKPILKKSKKEFLHNIEKPCAESKCLQVNEDNDGKIETYEVREGTRGSGGHFYEIKLLMLFYLRLQLCDEFYLAANMTNVGAFDDAVFKYKVRGKDGSIKTKIVFLQAKHSDKSGLGRISMDSLLDPKGAFSLKKYFESFQTIKRSFEVGEGPIFKECFHNCRFIIFTNYVLDVKCKKDISNPSRWMDCAVDEIAVSKEHIGKHLNPHEDINRDIITNLSCHPIRELAQEIYDYTLGTKKETGIRVSNELLQKYHIALANKVFTINKQHPNKSKFSNKFHESESLWKEFCNIAGNSQNEEQFREDLAKVTINLHKKFGKHEHKLEKESQINDLPSLSLPRPEEVGTEFEVKDFLSKLEFVLGHKNENELDDVIQTEIQEGCKVTDKEEIKTIFGSIKSKVESWWKSGNHFLTKQTKFVENAQTSISNFKLNVFENGLKKRIEKTGVQFNEIILDEMKNIIHSHKTRIIAAEDGTTLLSVVKSYQTLQREVGKIRYNFTTVDHVLNIQDYVLRVFQSKEEITYYLVIESNSELLTNVQWAGEENIRSFYNKLFELTERTANKHVILITEKSDKHNLNSHKIPLDICFGDLTDQSQLQLLDKVVTIQGMRVKFKDFISWSDLEFRNKIPSKLIMSLIDDDEIVISNAPQRLCDSEAAYTKYYEKIPLVKFLNMITDCQYNTVIVISRSREQKYGLLEELLNLSGIDEVMVDRVKKRIDNESIIIIPNYNPADTLKEFQRICTRQSEKTLYWVEIDSELFRLQQVYYPNFYLKREFRKTVVLRLEILCQENLKEVIVFNTADEKKVQNLVSRLKSKYMPHFYEKNTIENKIIFAKNSHDAHKKYPDLGQNISAHWLKVGGNCNEQLIWEKSQGSIETVRGFIKIDRCKVELHSEQQMSEVKDKVVVIADEPGMGKTTSLTSVSQQMLNKHWVIRINFLDCEHAIDKINNSHLTLEDVYNFASKVESTGVRNEWAKLLMTHKLHLDEQNTWPILFMFDGFDEISQKRRLKVLPFLQFIKYKTTARLWVTTRFHTMDILENGLSVIATEFEELSQKERSEFLNKSWINRLSPFLKKDIMKQRTEKYSSCLLEQVSDILGDGLPHSLGVPQQLRLLAEGLRQDYVNYINSDDDDPLNFRHVNVLYVYTHFIKEKYEIYRRDKNRLNACESLKLQIFRNFDKKHEMLAFDLLFPLDAIIKPTRLSRADENLLKSVGIIQSVGIDGKPYFIHRTFAEYFAAKFLFRYVEKKESNPKKYDCAIKFLSKNIFEESNHVIRNFINYMSIEPNEDFPIHFAAFRNNLGDLIKGTCANFNKCDKFGNTPLHIAAWKGHLNVVKALLDNGCDAIDKDVLGKTALHYAVMNGHVKIVEHILNYTADINICDNIFATPLHIDVEIGDSLFRDPEQLKSKLITMTNAKDIDGKAPLHYAAEMIDWEIASMLIAHGANISPLTDETASKILYYIRSTRRAKKEYKFGNSGDYILGLLMLKFVLPTDRVTAVLIEYLWAGHIKVFDVVRRYLSDHKISEILHRFTTKQEIIETICDEDHLEVVKYLLRQRNDERMTNTLAGDAARLGNLETMKYALAQRHKIDYISCMKGAIKNRNLNIVKLLEENFFYDDDGNTALHLAAHFDCLQITKYLVENNADVKVLNKTQQTPLEIASSFGNRIVQPYLRIKSNSGYDKPIKSNNNGNLRSTQENVIASTSYVFQEFSSNEHVQYVSLLLPNQNANTAEISEDKFKEFLCKFPEGIDGNGSTKFHWAAYIGDIKKLVSFYIDKLTYINVHNNFERRDFNGFTPLHYAVINDQIETVNFLLLRHIQYNPKNEAGRTPLDIAKGHSVKLLQEIHDIFNIFQNGGTNIDRLKSMHLKLNDSLMAAINCKDDYGNALLGYAASANDIDSVLFLLSNGVPFTFLSPYKCGTDVRHLLRCLYKIKESIGDNDGQFALKYIKCFDKYSCIGDVRGYDNESFLHDMAKTNSVNYYLLNYLVKHGANINALDSDNNSVISLAIDSSNLDMVKFLLYKGVHIKDLTPGDKQKLIDCSNNNDRPDITDLLYKTLLP